jgi:methylglutaconyl-CoA hydratase
VDENRERPVSLNGPGAACHRGATHPEENALAFETIATEMSPRGIATITLNRPDRGNAFNQAMLDELGKQFSAWAAEPSVRVVILRARGKHFCVGADVAAMSAKSEGEPEFTLSDTLVAIDTLQKPTVAVVEGGCVGGGLAFAACCDVVFATDAAFFSIPEVRLGMVPGLAPLFARALGPRALRRYGLSGERFSAAEGLRLGFVHEICEATKLEEKLAALADAFLHGAPGAAAELKAMASSYASPERTIVFPPKQARKPHARSPEMTEGLTAFREKRKPNWYPK